MNEVGAPAAVSIGASRPTGRPLRVCLIRPPMVMPTNSLSVHGPSPPIGLAYIAQAARSAGHNVTMIDGPGSSVTRYVRHSTPIGEVFHVGLSVPEILAQIPEDTKVVGISLMFFQEWPVTRDLIRAVHARYPHLRIVLGGETATAFAPWIAEQTPEVAYIVKGEGEHTFTQLLAALGRNDSPVDLPGLFTIAGGAPVDGGLPTRIRDLSTLGRPAWDLFSLDDYWAHPYFGVNRGRSMPVLATRGCPYQCTFCSAPQMWTTRFTVRDPLDLADEIEAYVRDWGIENINFVDLTAITKRSWAIEFCQELIRRDLGISWQLPLGTRSEVLDEELLGWLWRSGCRNVVYAPETGSERMVEVMNKRVDLGKLLDSVSTAHRFGLKTHVSIIIGHPQERLGDLLASARFMLRAAWRGCDDAAAIMFCPYPGSVDFAELLDSGRFHIDESAYYVGLGRSSRGGRSFNPRLSGRTLHLAQLAMMASFYSLGFARHPRRLVGLWRGRSSEFETTYFEQMMRNRRARRRSSDESAAA